ncbi:hypothetical protein Ccur_02940 [Cryptobacterium curtum DSM 15641]|uniref:Winged helix-turn-helix domain-containing protein n=1 Tax=Cryptobacterium curtum (strain ATCC 700683 / DSM 15641 / CCUG 43107 / 12-3) TaxID=469378 RepID=C7MM81_CRYCD|nr:helix-turn-helix domain-containing protein [Cryptobacterium curtum]ACU94021.1 hypothetical protein Ccur_02940 [Cryptobacterium curtum DSM 15641]
MQIQKLRIEAYMKAHGSITSREAMEELGVMRLASRISDMKRDGMRINKETVQVFNRYGEKCNVTRYSLAEEVCDA